MRIAAVSLALAASLVLVSCDQKPKDKQVDISTPDGKVTITGSEGNMKIKTHDGTQTVEIHSGESAAVNAPDFAPVFPGAKIASTVTGTGTSEGGMMSLTTNAEPQAVLAFYRGKAKAAGFVESMNATSGNTAMFAASDEKTKRGVQVTATRGDSETAVQVFWNGK